MTSTESGTTPLDRSGSPSDYHRWNGAFILSQALSADPRLARPLSNFLRFEPCPIGVLADHTPPARHTRRAWGIIQAVAMPPTFPQPDREVLAGVVERVTFHNADRVLSHLAPLAMRRAA
jgi:hypothetical protein